WENLEGLRTSAEVYGAPDEQTARARLAEHGVTHIAFFGWDGGLEQLLLSLDPSDDAEVGGPPRSYLHGLELAFRRGEHDALPRWLAPLAYVPPRVAGYAHPVVQLLEVVEEQPPEVSLVRLARWYQALTDLRMEPTLARALERG